MSTLKSVLISFFLLIYGCKCVGQKLGLRDIKIGETVPDMALNIHLSDSSMQYHLSDFRGKLVLLDFWGILCSDCIDEMPHMYDLQKQFGKQIQVVFVTSNNESSVKSLFNRIKGHVSARVFDSYIHMLTVTGDTLLYKMFPHIGVPKFAWIDSAGVYRGIAYATSTTVSNIQAFLNKKVPKLDLAFIGHLDVDRPLTWLDRRNGNLMEDSLEAYSFFTSRIAKLPVFRDVFNIDRDKMTGKAVSISLVNESILDMYRTAFARDNKAGKYAIPVDSILVDASARGPLVHSRFDSTWFQWADSNLYCYSIKIPQKSTSDIFENMQQDLDHFFGFESGSEMTQVKCLVIRKLNSGKILLSHSSEKMVSISVNSSDIKIVSIKGCTISGIKDFFEAYSSHINRDESVPILDETGFSGSFDIEIPLSDSQGNNISIDNVRQSLRSVGFDLTEEYKNRTVYYIKDTKTQRPTSQVSLSGR